MRRSEGNGDSWKSSSRIRVISQSTSRSFVRSKARSWMVTFYEQIVRQVKSQIMDGDLAAGEQLPSIRALANSLRVSAITTKRAYADLEAQGFIETVQGKGSFVAGGNADLLREERLREIEDHLLRALDASLALGWADEEIIERMRTLLESAD